MSLTPISFDCETHLLRPGVRTPRLVCASWKEPDRPAEMATREGAIKKFREIIFDRSKVMVAANIGFDAGVMIAADPTLLEPFFVSVEEGRVSDVSVRQALLDIRDGLWGYDRTQPSQKSETGFAKLKGRYRVEYLAKLYLNLDLSQEKNDPSSPRLRYCEMDGKPLSEYPKQFIDYSIGDAEHELDIWLAQERFAERTGNPNLKREPDEIRAAWSLMLMAIWGFRTDPEYVEKIASAIEQEHVESRIKLLEAGLLKIVTCKRKKLDDGAYKDELPDEITPEHVAVVNRLGDREWVKPFRNALAKGKRLRFSADTKAIKARVAAAYKGKPPMTENNGAKTDRDTLFESSDPVLELYGDTTNIEKLRSTYVPVLRQGTKFPINPEFNVLVESLRTSCGDPNIQNLPARGRYSIRPAFVSRPGTAFVSVDYNALEMVTLAQVLLWLFGYSRMAEAINSDQDLHCRLESTMLGEPYELVYTKAIKEKVLRYKNVRQGAKAGNFGFGGFMGAPKFVLAKRKDISEDFPDGIRFCELLNKLPHCGDAGTTIEFRGRECPPVCPVCVDIAYDIRCAYFGTWEEMNEFQRYVQAATRAEGQATLVVPGTKVERGGCAYSAFANGHFQGLAAVGAKRALWAVAKECYTGKSSPLFGCRPVAFIHDEIIIEAPLDRLHEAAFRLRDVMVREMQAVCPDVMVKAEPAAATRWYKAMDKVFDTNGRLVPWEPKQKALESTVPDSSKQG